MVAVSSWLLRTLCPHHCSPAPRVGGEAGRACERRFDERLWCGVCCEGLGPALLPCHPQGIEAQAGGSGDSGQRAKWVRLMMLLRLRERFSCWAGFRLVLTRKGIDAMCKAYKKGRRKRRDAGDDETETSADESRAEPGTGEPEQTASAAGGTLGRVTRRAATSTNYGGPGRQTTQGRSKACNRLRFYYLDTT